MSGNVNITSQTTHTVLTHLESLKSQPTTPSSRSINIQDIDIYLKNSNISSEQRQAVLTHLSARQTEQTQPSKTLLVHEQPSLQSDLFLDYATNSFRALCYEQVSNQMPLTTESQTIDPLLEGVDIQEPFQKNHAKLLLNIESFLPKKNRKLTNALYSNTNQSITPILKDSFPLIQALSNDLKLITVLNQMLKIQNHPNTTAAPHLIDSKLYLLLKNLQQQNQNPLADSLYEDLIANCPNEAKPLNIKQPLSSKTSSSSIFTESSYKSITNSLKKSTVIIFKSRSYFSSYKPIYNFMLKVLNVLVRIDKKTAQSLITKIKSKYLLSTMLKQEGKDIKTLLKPSVQTLNSVTNKANFLKIINNFESAIIKESEQAHPDINNLSPILKQLESDLNSLNQEISSPADSTLAIEYDTLFKEFQQACTILLESSGTQSLPENSNRSGDQSNSTDPVLTSPLIPTPPSPSHLVTASSEPSKEHSMDSQNKKTLYTPTQSPTISKTRSFNTVKKAASSSVMLTSAKVSSAPVPKTQVTSQNQTKSNRPVASIKPPGFQNFGNTCYLNATLKLTIHALTPQDIERIAQHKLHNTKAVKAKNAFVALAKAYHNKDMNSILKQRIINKQLELFVSNCLKIHVEDPVLDPTVLNSLNLGTGQNDVSEFMLGLQALMGSHEDKSVFTPLRCQNFRKISYEGKTYFCSTTQETQEDILMLSMSQLPAKNTSYQDVLNHNLKPVSLDEFYLDKETFKQLNQKEGDHIISNLSNIYNTPDYQPSIAMKPNAAHDIQAFNHTPLYVPKGSSTMLVNLDSSTSSYEYDHKKAATILKNTQDLTLKMPVRQEDGTIKKELFEPSSIVVHVKNHYITLTCDEFGHIYKHDDSITTKILPKHDENNPNQTLKRAVLDIPGATIRMMHYRKCK